MRKTSLFAVCLSLPFTVSAQKPRAPMAVNFENTTTYRWLNKPVLESRLLDDMENPATWVHEGLGEMLFTTERSMDGKQSLRLRSKTKTDKVPRTPGRAFGDDIAVRGFQTEDWNRFNRISFWVYPDLPGFRVISMIVNLRNASPERGRTLNYFLMRNREWNHIVWEIPDLARDKVTGLTLTYRLQGNEPEATDTVQFDIDHLELQRVEADYDEGWSVAPGLISFSHTGYQTGAAKRAFSSDLKAKEFTLLSQETGQPVFSKAVSSVKSRIGEFQVLDFTEYDQPGTYLLKAGSQTTRSFRIDPDVWTGTIEKAINFFYAERCGWEVPGVHGVCHRDWQGTHGDKSIIVNGGWHDAGDLSQGLVNTSEAVYAMFALAERLRAQGANPALADRVVEEAVWGLDWVIKTSFGDGYRVQWATMDFWTNGILGDNDDAKFEARNTPYENFLSAAAEAIGSRVLRAEDPQRAAHALSMARADWQFAVAGMAAPATGTRGSLTETASAGVLASLDLFKLTGERRYADKAVELGALILNAQQRTFLPGVEPRFTGMFYHSPEKTRLVHYIHPGHEQGPVVALSRLCSALPDHPDWMKWYSGVVLHSEFFQKQMSKFTAPYNHLPNGIWMPSEADAARGPGAEISRQQILNGWKLSDNYYLRAYPVQPQISFRGNFGTMLSQSKAVTEAAHLRGSLELAALGQDQLAWVVGRNPFSQSTMYGEGYDYAPQYTAMSGDMVGSLPVGIKMLGNHDLPYWPATNVWNYKEVWVHPVSRWLWLMEDLAGPATVEGVIAPAGSDPVLLRDLRTGKIITVVPDYGASAFRARIPEGRYEVSCGAVKKTAVLLPARTYRFDLRPENALDFEVSAKPGAGGVVIISVKARGAGRHRLALRVDNLAVTQPEREFELRPGSDAAFTWQAKIQSDNSPWVAVVVPDGNLGAKQEVVSQ